MSSLHEENGESLADIAQGHSALIGKSVISRHKYGKGEVILLGALSDEAGYKKLVSFALEDAGIEGARTEGTLVVIPRKGDLQKGMIVIEVANETGEIALENKMTDILTGVQYEGCMKVEPYSVYVLEG